MSLVPPTAAMGRRFRRRIFLATGVMAVLLAWDVTRPPAGQWTAWFAIGAIHAYRHTLSRLAPSLGARCRFTPTCSRYAEVVIRRHGIVVGGLRTAGRLLRCGPSTPAGTFDPPD